jgi:hypothetical protein
MSGQRVPGGVVHKLPADLREALIGNAEALDALQPSQCWVRCSQRSRSGSTISKRPSTRITSPS